VLEAAEKLAGATARAVKKLSAPEHGWMLWASISACPIPGYSTSTWLPTYLKEYVTWMPLRRATGRLPAAIWTGWLRDRRVSVAAFGSVDVAAWTVARRVDGLCGLRGAGCDAAVTHGHTSPLWAMVVMGRAGFANDLVMPGRLGACNGRGRKVRPGR